MSKGCVIKLKNKIDKIIDYLLIACLIAQIIFFIIDLMSIPVIITLFIFEIIMLLSKVIITREIKNIGIYICIFIGALITFGIDLLGGYANETLITTTLIFANIALTTSVCFYISNLEKALQIISKVFVYFMIFLVIYAVIMRCFGGVPQTYFDNGEKLHRQCISILGVNFYQKTMGNIYGNFGVASLTQNPNTFSYLCLYAFIFNLIYLKERHKVLKNGLYNVLLIIGILISGSRMAIALIPIVIILSFVIKKVKIKHIKVSILIAGIMALVVGIFITYNINMLSMIDLNGREDSWNVMPEIIKHNFFIGNGLDASKTIIKQLTGLQKGIFNSYYVMIINYGVIISAIFFTIIIKYIYNVVKKYKRESKNQKKLYLLTIIIMIIGLLQGITEQNILRFSVWNTIYILLINCSIILCRENINSQGENKMKNIGILVQKLCNGGAERAAANLSKDLCENYRVFLIVFDDTNITYDYAGELISLKIPPAKNKFLKIINVFRRTLKLKKIKQEKKLDACISFMEGANIVNVLSKNGEKIITSQRNLTSFFYKTKLQKAFIRFIANRSDKIVTLSKLVKKDLIDNFSIEDDKALPIYNSCDIERLKLTSLETEEIKSKMDSKHIYIANIGRLNVQKGQCHLIKAIRIVKEKIPNIKLLIIGKGELENKLKKLTADLDLNDNVEFVGFVKNPHTILKKCEIFVLSSIVEGLANVLLEASAFHKTIISTDCDAGPREILAPNTQIDKKTKEVEYGEYGILVPTFESNEFDYDPKMISEKEKILGNTIVSVLQDNELRKNYEEKNRIADFSPEKIKKEWIDLLKSI